MEDIDPKGGVFADIAVVKGTVAFLDTQKELKEENSTEHARYIHFKGAVLHPYKTVLNNLQEKAEHAEKEIDIFIP